MGCHAAKSRPSSKLFATNGTDGILPGVSTSQRRMARHVHWACKHGQTSWCKKCSGSSSTPTLSHSSLTIRTAFAQDVVAIPPYETSIMAGWERWGSLRRAVSVHMEFLSETGKVESKN